MEGTSRARLLLIGLLLLPLAGCEVVAGIFRAGVWVGVILAVVIIVGILWMVGKVRR